MMACVFSMQGIGYMVLWTLISLLEIENLQRKVVSGGRAELLRKLSLRGGGGLESQGGQRCCIVLLVATSASTDPQFQWRFGVIMGPAPPGVSV